MSVCLSLCLSVCLSVCLYDTGFFVISTVYYKNTTDHLPGILIYLFLYSTYFNLATFLYIHHLLLFHIRYK